MSARFYCCLLLLAVHLSSADRESATSGPYEVVFEADGSEHSTITVLLGDHVAWSTSPAADLISAAQVEQHVQQHGGDYLISTKTLQECNRVSYDGLSSKPGEPNTVISLTGKICDEDKFVITFQAIPAAEEFTHLQFNVTLFSSRYNLLRLTYSCAEDEGFYGFGAQYTRLNAKHNRLPLFLSEQGVGRGEEPITVILDTLSPGAGGTWYTTYTRVPFYMTNYRRALVVESLDYLVYDMTSPNMVTMDINSTSLIARIISGNSPLEIIQSYTAFAGRMAPLPSWVGEGAVLGLQGGTTSVLEALQEIKQVSGNLDDIAAVWLQDWTGQRNFTANGDLPRVGLWWNWEVDRQHYPNWEELINSLYSQGVKVLTYINPLLTDITKRATPFQHNYYQEGIDNGYFIVQGDGHAWTGYSNASIIDLSNPKAYQWIMNMIIENMLATNVSGWMCDFGESVPLDAKLNSGENPARYHSLYPSVWGQVNADAISTAVNNGIITKAQGEEVVYFMRSGNVYSPSATRLFWLGDQMVTWDSQDGLASTIIGMLSSGISGYSLTHSDIGGYTSLHVSILKYLRSKELFMRWCELSAFTVTYRTHLGTLPNQNWQYNSDRETLNHFLRMTKVFKAWEFYRTSLINDANERGWPVVRHMFLTFPNNSKVYTEDLRYQFMLGSELLVAPVYSESQHSAQQVQVFLPADSTWVHVWTNKTYPGNDEWVNLPAPLGQPCVLYPHGSQVGEQFTRNLNSILK